MKIRLDHASPFNLDATLRCGQAFRWNKQGEWWYGVVGKHVFKIRQISKCLEFENVDEGFVKDYFGLQDNLLEIFSRIGKDEHVKRAVNMFSGLRILRQNPWECLISYICATYKNIAAIKKMLFNLSKNFGQKISFDKQEFYTFPEPKRLTETTIEELKKCSLGYRAKYVSETAKMVYKKDLGLERLKMIPYEEARKELLRFPGVGLKVADCVLLFSLGKLDAFPVDVWIKRIILKYYVNCFPEEFVNRILHGKSFTCSDYEKLNLFGRNYFGEFAGYAQEYLYHWERACR